VKSVPPRAPRRGAAPPEAAVRKPAANGPSASRPAARASAASAPTKRAPTKRAPTKREPTKRGPTSTQRIVVAVTQAIVERRLMPGTKLAEQKLADAFAVSRTIVRQALNQLSRDGLVVLEPARGAFVATPGVDEARQVFEARQLIESAIVRDLAARITREQVATLRTHLRDEAAAIARTDVPGRTRLLADFHTVLAAMTGNQVLTRLLGELLSRSSLIALMYQSAHSAEASYAEHVAIVDALERRDVAAAERLSTDHLHHVEHNLRLDPRAPDLAQLLTAPVALPA
jgi:DNA-binding GntR family transcriptional regulator